MPLALPVHHDRSATLGIGDQRFNFVHVAAACRVQQPAHPQYFSRLATHISLAAPIGLPDVETSSPKHWQSQWHTQLDCNESFRVATGVVRRWPPGLSWVALALPVCRVATYLDWPWVPLALPVLWGRRLNIRQTRVSDLSPLNQIPTLKPSTASPLRRIWMPSKPLPGQKRLKVGNNPW
ncbi:hypothetical protein EC9_52270 [Rosistilla ulvae]|uniref:Uncharacterized protein n=1 Tax=Rosistilla ulvae TaxID=1930277 RepID=A0A517M7Y6_9BACT|nr:hypothetical protein EC9_52270 [Rosistilla ulvae]